MSSYQIGPAGIPRGRCLVARKPLATHLTLGGAQNPCPKEEDLLPFQVAILVYGSVAQLVRAAES